MLDPTMITRAMQAAASPELTANPGSVAGPAPQESAAAPVPYLETAMEDPETRTALVVSRATTKRQSALDDFGVRMAAEQSEAAMKRAQDAQRAYLGAAHTPLPQAPQMQTTVNPTAEEAGMSFVGGLLSGKWLDSANATMNLAGQRQQREFANATQAYEGDVQQRKVDLDTLFQEFQLADQDYRQKAGRLSEIEDDQRNFAQQLAVLDMQQQGRSDLEGQKMEGRLALQELVNQGRLDQNNLVKQFEETRTSLSKSGLSMSDEELWNIVAATEITKLQNADTASRNADARAIEADSGRMRAMTAQEALKVRNEHFYKGWAFRSEERKQQAEDRRTLKELEVAAAMDRLMVSTNQKEKEASVKLIDGHLRELEKEKRQALKQGAEYRGALTKTLKPEEKALIENSLAELGRYVTTVLDPQINELRKVSEAAKSPFGAAPARGQASSRGSSPRTSSKRHEAEAAEIKKLFGSKVEVWSEPRPMRGGGGTGMSRHGEGRAVDAHYKNLNQREQLIQHAQGRKATLIIDYVGKRTWRPGRGWKASPKLDSSLRHIHIEFD